MKSKFEFLPTEIFFEIFDYLTTFDIFYGFIHLNQQFDHIIHSYPIQLDFQDIIRRKFDIICQSIHPKQIISLYLSEELMPDQVQLFHQYFPLFSEQFLSLKKFKCLNTSFILPSLPVTLSSLTIKTYRKTSETDQSIVRILRQQSQHLTYLAIDGSYAFRSIDVTFPRLTHFILDYCTVSEFHRILTQIQSPLILLKIYFDKEDTFTLPNFQQLTNSLQYISMIFSEELTLSFQQLINCISVLIKLKSFTVQATGEFNLLDGQLWQNYLAQTSIQKFNFKFTLANDIPCPQDKQTLLQSFRSSFWLDEHHWHTACEKGQLKSSRPTIYSIPYFQLPFIFYPTNTFLPISTCEPELYSWKQSINLILTFHRAISLPTRRFSPVSALTLLTSSIPSIDILQSVVDLDEILELDISLVKSLSLDDLQNLLDQMPRLRAIKMQFNPLYYPPLHIYSYILIRKDKEMSVLDENNIQRFLYLFYHIKYLEITIRSKEILIQLLNQLHYLERIKIFCYQNSLKNIHQQWFYENIPRLKTVKFTYRITPSYLFLSIGDPIRKPVDTIVTKNKLKLKSHSRCKLQ